MIRLTAIPIMSFFPTDVSSLLHSSARILFRRICKKLKTIMVEVSTTEIEMHTKLGCSVGRKSFIFSTKSQCESFYFEKNADRLYASPSINTTEWLYFT